MTIFEVLKEIHFTSMMRKKSFDTANTGYAKFLIKVPHCGNFRRCLIDTERFLKIKYSRKRPRGAVTVLNKT